MTLIEPAATGNRFLTETDWNGYLKYLEAVGDRHIKVTYDRGRLELMTPSGKHEQVKSRVGRLLETMMDELGTDFVVGGSTTFKRQQLDRGLEPDECYWIAHAMELTSGPWCDDESFPPPDLVIEVEVSRSALDRIGIYAAMGVPEVWRCTADGGLRILRLLPEGRYETVDRSPTFPELPPEQLIRHALLPGMTDARRLRAFRAWVREHLG